jgi:hypothetical protein
VIPGKRTAIDVSALRETLTDCRLESFSITNSAIASVRGGSPEVTRLRPFGIGARGGFEWFFPSPEGPDENLLINVWSAPNYCCTSGNRASILKVGFSGTEELAMTKVDPATTRLKPAVIS